ncbi:hypothetical protein CQ054_02810 [Ochrobactrum sp. MYb29]|nr:hypothetical protein CQ054_02810 [Ochrobactrum sp. MYb29]
MTVVPFLSQNEKNEITGLMMAATAAIVRVGGMIPFGAHPDTFKAIFADAQRTAVLDACVAHLAGYDRGLANFMAEVANEQPLESTQRVTESHEPDLALSAIEVDESAWRACMAEIKAIITAPYNGGAGIGYDPLNEIGLAIAKHLNVVPGDMAKHQSAA